jgi:hypothetical protein
MMDYYEIMKKLIGNIEPVGESHTDDPRYGNLKEYMALAERLLVDIASVAGYADRPEYSMSRAGTLAKEYLNNVYDYVEDYIND